MNPFFRRNPKLSGVFFVLNSEIPATHTIFWQFWQQWEYVSIENNMWGRRGGGSPEIPNLAALGYPPRQDERGQMTVGGWRVGVGGDVNVPCDLLSLLMLRHAGVGVGMVRHAGVGAGGGGC